MRLGYNTNGFPYHRLEDAITILAELGYRSIALTLDHHSLTPFSPTIAAQAVHIRRLLEKHGLRNFVETGARFLLDPRRKHQPTILSANSEERGQRLDFLRRAIDLAVMLGSDGVSFWSGAATDDEGISQVFQRFCDSCLWLADYAADRNVRLAFEPEPGMFIDTLSAFGELHKSVAHPAFGLTIDIGHVHSQGEDPVSDRLREWSSILWNIHIEDMRRGVHEHLMFGEGEIDFPPILQTLETLGYTGGIYVELSRHGHDAVNTASNARDFLRRIWPSEGGKSA